jgi:hypothetical protein
MYHDDDRDAGIASDLIKIKRRDEIESGIFLIEYLLTVTHARPSTSRDRRAQSRTREKKSCHPVKLSI